MKLWIAATYNPYMCAELRFGAGRYLVCNDKRLTEDSAKPNGYVPRGSAVKVDVVS